MKTKNPIVITIGVLIMALAAMPAISQDKPADNMQILREKIKTDKKLLVAENMGLTDSEAKAFWSVYDSYQSDLTKLGDRMLKLIVDYSKNYQTMSDEVAKKLMDDYMAIEGERQKLRQAYLPKFRKVLTEKKVVRYYQLENKIQAAVNYELAAQIPLVK